MAIKQPAHWKGIEVLLLKKDREMLGRQNDCNPT